MSNRINPRVISSGAWEIGLLDDGTAEGQPYGMYLTGQDMGLQGSDFLTVEEAIELRDYINEHFGHEQTK